MAYLRETWSWATLEVDLKAYLGITGSSEDDLLERLTIAALRAGDQFLNNPWTVEDTPESMWGTESGDDIIPPEDVKTGVFEWVGEKRREKQSETSVPPGMALTSKKTGDLSEGYGLTSRPWSAGPDPLWKTLWYPYRMELLF